MADGSILHTQTKRYEALDGMRGLCALLVVLLHFDFALSTGILARHGALAVDMFFVLSGFVIAFKYQDRLQSRNGFGSFLGARAARLVPVQMLGTVAATASLLIVYLTGNLPGASAVSLTIALLYGLLLIPIGLSPVANVSFYWVAPFPVNPPLWSLLAEWLVNIVYGRWLSSVRTWLLMLLWAVLTLYLVNHVFSGKRSWDLAREFEWIACMTRAAIGFLAGVVMHRANRRGLLDKLPAIDSRLVFGIWAVICFVPDSNPMPVFESVAALVVAPLSVALLIRGERPLSQPYIVLGRLSYPLYASHFAIVNLAMLVAPLAVGHSLLVVLLPMLLGALLLAWGIDRIAALMPALLRRRRALARA